MTEPTYTLTQTLKQRVLDVLNSYNAAEFGEGQSVMSELRSLTPNSGEPVAWQCKEIRGAFWQDCSEERAGVRAANPDKWEVRELFTHPAPSTKPADLPEGECFKTGSVCAKCGNGEFIADHAPSTKPAEWQPIETAPKDGTLVVVYSPNGPDDWPDALKVAFDYVCPDYEDWFYHCESYEHYMAVGGSNACGPDAVCTGPSAKAPYTHWLPLPAAPQQGETK
jgi:hypothetical protein